MKNKALTLLGFAAKAGKLSFGFADSLYALKKGKSQLLIAAEDVSEKSKKEITFYADKRSIEVLTFNKTDILELSNAVGHKCGIISVNDNGFARSLKEEILNDQ